MKASGGGRLEELASYARARRVGPFVFVAGTTSMQSDGTVFAPYDMYEQSIYIFKKMEEAWNAVGAKMQHVVRTRAFVTDMREGGGFIKAHGEIFKGIEPVTSGVEAGLTTPGMMVEIEIDAIIHSDDGGIEGLSETDATAVPQGEHTPEFKTKVALEAIQGDASLSELASKYGVQVSLVAEWKRQVSENMANIFDA